MEEERSLTAAGPARPWSEDSSIDAARTAADSGRLSAQEEVEAVGEGSQLDGKMTGRWNLSWMRADHLVAEAQRISDVQSRECRLYRGSDRCSAHGGSGKRRED